MAGVKIKQIINQLQHNNVQILTDLVLSQIFGCLIFLIAIHINIKPETNEFIIFKPLILILNQ